MSKNIFVRASLYCGVSLVVIASALVGCTKKQPEKQSVPTPTKAHMTDAKLKAELRGQIAEREALARARQTIVGKMEELVAKKYKGDMKAAANDPEMVSLIRRARDLETNFTSNRVHTAEKIRAAAWKGAQPGAAPNNAAGASPKNDLKKEVK